MEERTGPTYPGIIPYHVDHSQEDRQAGPRLLGMEPRPPSTGPPSSTTVLGYRRDKLSEEEVRDKFFSYWQKQTSREGWLGRLPDPGLVRRHSPTDSSPGGSQAALLSTKEKRIRWPHSFDFLAASWAYSLSLHSIWFYPIALLQHGGLVFLLMYAGMLILLGGPLLLLEFFLGQYTGLVPVRLYRHLCPLLSGLGLTVCVLSLIRMILDLAVVTWAGQSLFILFSQQTIRDGFFYRDVLSKESADLAELGSLSGQLTLILGIGAVLTFVLVAAGTRSLGKVCMVLIPVLYMLLVSLVIRSCIATGGLQGLTSLLSPDWEQLTRPAAWLEATCQVVFSLQLGLGSFTTYASYNKFSHNLIRDALIVLISHLVWTLLCVLLILSLLGVAHTNQAINLSNLVTDPALVSITGKGVWMVSITLVETSLSSISYGWLWAGIFFLFILLVALSSIFGYLEVLCGSITSLRPGLLPYRPAISFLILVVVFLFTLLMTTQGGIHVYHLLHSYLYQWPLLLVCLLTLVPTIFCHGVRNLMKDLTNMSGLSLSHWVNCHLSTLFYTVMPVLTTAGLCWSLYSLALEPFIDPLSTFSLSLPAGWGEPLGWALTFLPLSPILLAAIVHLTCGARGIPKKMHLRRSVMPTDRYYRHEHLELTAEARTKYSNGNVSVV